MNTVQCKICPTCGNPYGTLPPIGPRPTLPDPTVATIPGQFVDVFNMSPKPVSVTPQLLATFADPEPIQDVTFDNPVIGGHVTICVLLFGDYPDMHTTCLNGIINSTSADRVSLRVVCNAIGAESIALVQRLQSSGRIAKLITNYSDVKKYPAMRQLFHDPHDPIKDKWVVWFDGDSIVKDQTWLTKLLQTISNYYPQNYALFGTGLRCKLHPDQINWIKSRSWYKGRFFQLGNGREAPNGGEIHYASGGFFALPVELIKNAGIPDEDIGNDGGDYMIGEAIWQAGYALKTWNTYKNFVSTSTLSNKGQQGLHVGMPGWSPGVAK